MLVSCWIYVYGLSTAIATRYHSTGSNINIEDSTKLSQETYRDFNDKKHHAVSKNVGNIQQIKKYHVTDEITENSLKIIKKGNISNKQNNLKPNSSTENPLLKHSNEEKDATNFKESKYKNNNAFRIFKSCTTTVLHKEKKFDLRHNKKSPNNFLVKDAKDNTSTIDKYLLTNKESFTDAYEDLTEETTSEGKKLTFLTLYPQFDVDAPLNVKIIHKQTRNILKHNTLTHDGVRKFEGDKKISQKLGVRHSPFIELMTMLPYKPTTVRTSTEFIYDDYLRKQSIPMTAVIRTSRQNKPVHTKFQSLVYTPKLAKRYKSSSTNNNKYDRSSQRLSNKSFPKDFLLYNRRNMESNKTNLLKRTNPKPTEEPNDSGKLRIEDINKDITKPKQISKTQIKKEDFDVYPKSIYKNNSLKLVLFANAATAKTTKIFFNNKSKTIKPDHNDNRLKQNNTSNGIDEVEAEELITDLQIVNYDFKDELNKIDPVKILSRLAVKDTRRNLRTIPIDDHGRVLTEMIASTKAAAAISIPRTLFPITVNINKAEETFDPVTINLNRTKLEGFVPGRQSKDIFSKMGYFPLAPSPAQGQKILVDNAEALHQKIQQDLDLGRNNENFDALMFKMATLGDRRKMLHKHLDKNLDYMLTGRRNINSMEAVDRRDVSDDLLDDPILRNIDAGLEK